MTPHDSLLLGLDHQQFASAAIGVALAALAPAQRPAFGAAERRRPASRARPRSGRSLLIALTGVYAYRFEASEIVERITGELFPSEPEVGRGGEVIVNQRLGGEFAIAGRVNGARVTFLFDTGASAVVLTAADARRAGVDTAASNLTRPSPPPMARRWRRRFGSTRSRSGRS